MAPVPLPGSSDFMTPSKLFISLLKFWFLICEIWTATVAYHEDDMNAFKILNILLGS